MILGEPGSGRSQATPQIISLRLPGCNAYAIRQHKTLLVDSGLIHDGNRLLYRLADLDLLDDLTLALATHGHADHTGGLATVKQAAPERIKIAAHAAAVPFVEAGRNAPCRPATLLGYLARPFIPLFASPPGVSVDVVIRDELRLAPYGVDGTLVPTPGHTLGCVSVVLPGGRAVVGDLLMTAFGRGDEPRLPLFTEDVALWKQSVDGLLNRGVDTFYAGHGGPFSARQVRRLLERV